MRRGFTLVEVLVALLIMAVLATMAWQGIDGIARSRSAAQVRMERTLRLSSVIGQWHADLQAIHDTDKLVPAFGFDGATLRLVRRTEDGVQFVAWSLRGDALTRWAGPGVTRSGELQEQWMRSQQLLGTEPGQLRTLSGVVGWRLYCYRGNAWSNCQSSADRNLAQRETLPDAVRVVLTLPEGTLTRDLMLAPHEP